MQDAFPPDLLWFDAQFKGVAAPDELPDKQWDERLAGQEFCLPKFEQFCSPTVLLSDGLQLACFNIIGKVFDMLWLKL